MLILFMYGLLAISFWGWGQLLCRGIKCQEEPRPVLAMWIGWATVLFLLQAIHLFQAITAGWSIGLVLIGLLRGLGPFKQWVSVCFFSWGRMDYGFAIGLVFLAAWGAGHAMLAPTNWDSGLYHFNAIAWINQYPIIPGLGNLHDRLAFNQSFFHYAALLNFEPYFGQGRVVANSFLWLLGVAQYSSTAKNLLQNPQVLPSDSPFRLPFILLTFPALAFLAASSDGFTSPTPDLAATLLQLAVFPVFLEVFLNQRENKQSADNLLVFICVLSATAITVKLSNLVFGGLSILLISIMFYRSRSILLLKLTGFCSLAIGLWMVRGVIQSGAPFFPSSAITFDMDWAMPKEAIDNCANWVYSWARHPGPHWRDVLGNWAWFWPWVKRYSHYYAELSYPLGFSLLSLCFLGFWPGRSWRLLRPLGWIMAFFVCALTFWFIQAPDVRFAHALFMLFCPTCCCFLLVVLKSKLPSRAYMIAFGLLFLISNLHFLGYGWKYKFFVTRVSLKGWQAPTQAELNARVTQFGLSVLVPKSGDLCWDSPLPSTPYFNPNLKLRNPNDLRSGFTISRATP
ncbi:MAG: hypothetical protein H6510_00460 [Acidobacteria bacterium]|nr:hypothetical protein [Acidobacteriota bacterium]MCB9396260.1 hypothetical protein [Acidobacteriota bacterium]